MEKKMFRTGMVRTVLSVIFLAVVMLFLGFLTFSFGQDIFIGTDILDSRNFGEFVHMNVRYLSESFASDSTGTFHFASVRGENDRLNDFILYLPDDVSEREDVRAVIANTYSSEETDLAPLSLHGYVMESFEELDEAAGELYRVYTNLEESEDPADYLGNYYVSYTASSAMSAADFETWLAFIVSAVFLVIAILNMIQAISRQTRRSAKVKRAQELYVTDSNYIQGVEQTKRPSAVFYKAVQCYVTDDYVVTYQDGLEVFRIDQIQELYGYDNSRYTMIMGLLFGVFASGRTMHQLVAITKDGEVHQFATQGVFTAHQQIMTQLLTKNPFIRIGREGKTAQELNLDLATLNPVKITGFYGSNKPWEGRTLNTFSIE